MIFAFVVGICIGSFLNVVIIRLPRGRSIIRPSSRCGFCRTALKWAENIPVLGFFLCGGMCKKCGRPFSIRYAFIEMLTGVFALAVYSVFGWTITALFMFAFVSILIAVSFIDLDLKLIPDSLSLGGWAAALLLIFVAPKEFGISFLNTPLSELGMSIFLQAALSSVVGYGLFWILARAYYFLRKEEGLGGGDLKLMGLVGAVLGFQGIITTLLVGSALGALIGIGNILIKGRSKHSPIPFGPFLSIGAALSALQLDRILWP